MKTEEQIRKVLVNTEEAYKLINFDDEWKQDYTGGFLAALYFVLDDKEEDDFDPDRLKGSPALE